MKLLNFKDKILYKHLEKRTGLLTEENIGLPQTL